MTLPNNEHDELKTIVDEHVRDLEVTVREHRCPRPEDRVGDPAVPHDQVRRQHAGADQRLALAVEARRCPLGASTAPP